MNKSTTIVILLSILLALLAGCGGTPEPTATPYPTRYETLPKAKKPMPEKYVKYFMALESRELEDEMIPDEWVPLHEEIKEYSSTANEAWKLIWSGLNMTLQQAREWGASVISGDNRLMREKGVEFKSTQEAMDFAKEVMAQASEAEEAVREELEQARAIFLEEYGIQAPDTYRAVTVSGDAGWIAADSGQFLEYSEDSGWHETAQFEGYEIHALALDVERGWAVGREGILLRYVNGAWEPYPFASESFFRSVVLGSGSESWAVNGKQILHFTGTAWEEEYATEEVEITLSTTAREICKGQVYDLALDAEGNGWAVGSETILRRSDGKWRPWEAIPANLPELKSVAMLADHAWAVGGTIGASGQVLYYDGSQWVDVETSTDETLLSVASSPDGQAWAVGNKGVILLCTPSGCDSQASPTQQDLLDIVLFEDGTAGWIVGTNNTILHFDGKSWSKVIDWEMMAQGK